MKSLVQFLKEELDDNLWWLLDKWFEYHENQYSEFIEVVVKCKERGRSVSIDFLKETIKGTFLENQLKQFVNFIDNEVSPVSNKDYLYALKMIVEQCIGNDIYDRRSLKGYLLESLKPYNCWIMVGIAGAGKSTWIKDNLPKGIKIVNQDQIRIEMGIMKDIDKKAIGNELEEQEVRRKNDSLINRYIGSRTDFVIDNTNISYGRTLNLYQRLKASGANVKIVIIDTDVETCLRRRKNDIPEKIIRQMGAGVEKIKKEFKHNKDCIFV